MKEKILLNRMLHLHSEDSLILLGPRGVGKSTLIKSTFKSEQCLWIDLLSPKEEARYARDPDSLKARVNAMTLQQQFVVIDEIQKVPKLLDVVHGLVEETDKCFVLTGSSARKLKKNAANLLAGRAFIYHLAPFTFSELGKNFCLEKALNWGMLPKVCSYQSDRQRKQFLQAYAHTYLKEEIWAEQLIRELDPFRNFLEVAAQCNGKVINFSNIAKDVGVSYHSVQNYYSILEDTLLGFFVPPYASSLRKQLKSAPKFYFFDVGVSRALSRLLSMKVKPATSYYGEMFECFVITEIKKMIDCCNNEYKISYLQTKAGIEIDLIVERPGQKNLLIDVKSSEDVSKEKIKNFITLANDFPNSEAIVLSRDDHAKKYGQITVYPWQEGILKYFFAQA